MSVRLGLPLSRAGEVLKLRETSRERMSIVLSPCTGAFLCLLFLETRLQGVQIYRNYIDFNSDNLNHSVVRVDYNQINQRGREPTRKLAIL